MLPEYEDFTTVEVLMDGDLIIVGEEHGNENSKRLMQRILDKTDPGMTAVEQGPHHARPVDGAMGEVARYAEREGIDLWHIDNEDRWRSIRSDTDMRELLDVANQFSHEIQLDGDLDERAITDARERVRDQFGNEVFNAVYPDREETMAEYLRWLGNITTYPPAVAAVGAFHLPAIAEIIEEDKPTLGRADWDRVTQHSLA